MINIPTIAEAIQQVEDRLITIALAKTKGNRAAAARMIGLSERTMSRKVKERIAKDNTKKGM